MKKNLLMIVVGLLVSACVAAFLFIRGYSSIKKGNLTKVNQQQQNLYSDSSSTDTSGEDSGDSGDSGDDGGD